MGILAILSALESILGNDLVIDAIYALLNEIHVVHGPDKIKQMFEAAKEMLAGGIDAAHACQNIIGDYNAAYHHATVIVSAAMAHNAAAAQAPQTPPAKQ